MDGCFFAVMFGMGLAKFRRWDERTRRDYLYHFLEWQPFPCAPSALLRSFNVGSQSRSRIALVRRVYPFSFLVTVISVGGDGHFIGLQLFIWWVTLGLSICLQLVSVFFCLLVWMVEACGQR